MAWPPTAALTLLLLAAVASPVKARTCEPGEVAYRYPGHAGRVVRIAASPTQPPFAFSSPNDPERMTGLEVEAIEKALSCAGLKFQYVKGVWSGLLPALFSGAADVMIGAVNYRPDRAERADFVLFMRAGQSVVVTPGNPRRVTGMDTLCGTIGSSVMGGSPAQAIERQSLACTQAGKPPIDFRPSTASDASYRQLVNGRVDFVMDDAAAVAARVEREAGIEIAYTMTTDILSGMVVAKGDKEMLQIVADGLAVQWDDGTLVALAKKYGLPPESMIPIETRR